MPLRARMAACSPHARMLAPAARCTFAHQRPREARQSSVSAADSPDGSHARARSSAMAARVISLLSARELLHALLVGGAAGAALVGIVSVTNSSDELKQAQASPAQAQAAPRAAKHAPPPPRAWDANWDRRGERRASDVTRTLILVRCVRSAAQRSAAQRSAAHRSATQRTCLHLHTPDAQHTSVAATGSTPTSRRRRRTRSTS
jgi:hypothetical protein